MTDFSQQEREEAAREIMRLRYPREHINEFEIRKLAQPGYDIVTDFAITAICQRNRLRQALFDLEVVAAPHMQDDTERGAYIAARQALKDIK
jgi:hypothetical protein